MTIPEPPDAALARRVLTDTQFLTWAMAEQGISHRAIGYFRRVSKATVTDCLEACDRRIRQAKKEEADATHPSR